MLGTICFYSQWNRFPHVLIPGIIDSFSSKSKAETIGIACLVKLNYSVNREPENEILYNYNNNTPEYADKRTSAI